jgi:uncharacterized protein (DUF1919 family)
VPELNLRAFLKSISADSIVSAIKWKFIDRYFSWLPRSKLKNRDFSIIGNNCFAGGIYHKFGLQYGAPTIWTYIFPDDYIRLLENLDWYLQQPLAFKKETAHQMAQKHFELLGHRYPVGVLGGDIEIHFMHCQSEQQALEKWSRRLKRLNRNNLFVLFSDGEEYHDDLLEKFERLPYKHKIFFSSKPCPQSKCTVFVQDYANAPFVFDSTRNRRYERYIDLVRWLNGEENFLR